jgi:single-strand DNA-binding protein
MINKVILVGNVGNDPDIRHIDQNTTVVNFSMATSETYKDKQGQPITNTEWHKVTAWRWQAEFVEKYVKKGSQVYIEGKLKTRSWDDKDGNKRYTTEVIVDQIKLLGRKEESIQEQNTSTDTSNEPFDDPDLPF